MCVCVEPECADAKAFPWLADAATQHRDPHRSDGAARLLQVLQVLSVGRRPSEIHLHRLSPAPPSRIITPFFPSSHLQYEWGLFSPHYFFLWRMLSCETQQKKKQSQTSLCLVINLIRNLPASPSNKPSITEPLLFVFHNPSLPLSLFYTLFCFPRSTFLCPSLSQHHPSLSALRYPVSSFTFTRLPPSSLLAFLVIFNVYFTPSDYSPRLYHLPPPSPFSFFVASHHLPATLFQFYPHICLVRMVEKWSKAENCRWELRKKKGLEIHLRASCLGARPVARQDARHGDRVCQS